MKSRDIAMLQMALGTDSSRRPSCWSSAFTHSSQARELEALQAIGAPRVGDNEQLEFLGDAVLGVCNDRRTVPKRFPAFAKANFPSCEPTWSARST